MTTQLLKFSDANGKLKALRTKGIRISTFSLPAGWTCPAAMLCKAKVGREGGLVDGPDSLFRCFAASDESQYTATRNQRWHNFDLLKGLSVASAAALISKSLPRNSNTIRIHVSGDFYSANYFRSWCLVARDNPSILFYAYTKSIPYWLANQNLIPSNLVLTASVGGRYDDLIEEHSLKSARVVFSIAEAKALGLPIDHDDSHAIDKACRQFALLVHHVQPAGSLAGQAVRALAGLGSYSGSVQINHERALAVDALA